MIIFVQQIQRIAVKLKVSIWLVLVFSLAGCSSRWAEQRQLIETGEGYEMYSCSRRSTEGRCERCGTTGTGERSCPGCKANFIPNTTLEYMDVKMTTTDQTVIANIAWTSNSPDARKAAVNKLTSQEALATIARGDSDTGVQQAAMRRLTSQEVLEGIAKKNSKSRVRESAVWKLTSQDVLEEIAQNDTDREVRQSATKRLTKLRESAQ